jgi:hypothetical protein
VKLIDAFHNAGLPVVVVNVNPLQASWSKARKDATPRTVRLLKEVHFIPFRKSKLIQVIFILPNKPVVLFIKLPLIKS